MNNPATNSSSTPPALQQEAAQQTSEGSASSERRGSSGTEGASPPGSRPASTFNAPVKLSRAIQEVLAKPKDVFLKELYAFMESIAQPITKMPSLGYQELDLHKLFHAVVIRGGMDEVTRRQEWKLVYQDLEIPTMSTSASYNTRTNYKKYLYLYELDICDWGEERPESAPGPKFSVGEYVRIVSSTFDGQVFYAQISKYRYRNGTNSYYVHYNGWSTSHDEWMPEVVLNELTPEEREHPAELANPSPTRSSKSNYIIYDPLVSEKHHQRMVATVANAISSGQTSAQTTPKAKRRRSVSGRRETESDENEAEDFVISSMAAASQHANPPMHTYNSNGDNNQFLPQAVTQRIPAFRRRPVVVNGKPGFFMEELDHPAVHDRLHGFPFRRRSFHPALDFSLGMPQQLYYFGGQWKHSTPQVRKYHVHRSVMQVQEKKLGRINEELLRVVLMTPEIRSIQTPDLQIPKLPPVSKAMGIPPIDAESLPRMAVSELQRSIQEKEERLKELKKDLKLTTKLLKKYYGKEPAKPNAASALLSSAFKVSRR